MSQNHAPYIVHHITNRDTTLADCLKSHFKVEPSRLEDLLKLGAIYSDKKRVLSNRPLPKGTYLRIHLQPRRFDVSGLDLKNCIVHSSKEFLVVNKPAGLPVHAAVDNQIENLLHLLRIETGENLLVTQRLDNPVSGLVVFAKTDGFQKRFNKWLVDRKLVKKYTALTESSPALGLHVHYMNPAQKVPREVVLEERKDWLRCELTIEKVVPVEKHFQSTVILHTGRTHQIRAQLRALGCPILGDSRYGSRTPFMPGRLALASTYLELPDTKLSPNRFELSEPFMGTSVRNLGE